MTDKKRSAGKHRAISVQAAHLRMCRPLSVQAVHLKMHRAVSLLAALLIAVLLPGGALGGEGRWLTLTEQADQSMLFQVADEYTGTVRLTFLGDCTLGGEESMSGSALGFNGRIRQEGMAFPFRNLLALTDGDDLTLANLEGVLSDRKLEKVPKEYNFIGPTAYTEILTLGGIDSVTLANNHSHDYGEEGYADTVAALEEAGIGWLGTDAPAIWRSGDGVMIGFLGASWSLTGSRYTRFARQAEMLKEAGCAAIITVMHAGTEYSYAAPDARQKQIVSRAVQCGSDLIIGHHPHVVQGMDCVDGVPVVYSLGNCSFGGTTRAKDSDALAVQAELTFAESELTGITLRCLPISITSDDRYNNYSPRLLSGGDAERVLKKMKESTGFDVSEGTVTFR